MNVIYGDMKGSSDTFCIEVNERGQITGIRNPGDKYGMNWVKGDHLVWGEIKGSPDLNVSVSREFTDRGTLRETYCFRNDTEFDVYTAGTEFGVCTPFPDYYTDAAVCLTTCCHTHLWCGGCSSYIMALRMGGEAPHLGLILREGSLKGYSVERIAAVTGVEEELSNHRGDFILHPESLHIRPGETYTIAWELVWFDDREEFEQILSGTEGFIRIASEAFVLTEGEEITFEVITPDIPGATDVLADVEITAGQEAESEESRPGEITVRRDGRKIPYTKEKGRLRICEKPETTGEYNYEIGQDGRISRTAFLVMPDIVTLAGKRLHFIAEHQQCRDEKSHLNGAYLIYDNEERRQYYGHRNDTNGGRERVGMGILFACYLKHCPDAKLRESLDRYVEYVLRELYDEETGEVFNDAPRCNDYIRLYNDPWMCRFFLEMYGLTKDSSYLDRYMKCIARFYRLGGTHFYAIAVPMYESVKVFEEAGRTEDAETLLGFYKEHGDYIAECGRDYPAHEVAYEQSIVAPAASYMGELYRLTGEKKYKEAAMAQYGILELFQGNQPDYHMNGAAIRHWDGYWFGKKRCLGDTFPHYWSALTGWAYLHSREAADTDRYLRKVRGSLRGVLSLFREDGSASCAMVYPMSVNGKEAAFYDPWANDQDWGLYFNLKYIWGC